MLLWNHWRVFLLGLSWRPMKQFPSMENIDILLNWPKPLLSMFKLHRLLKILYFLRQKRRLSKWKHVLPTHPSSSLSARLRSSLNRSSSSDMESGLRALLGERGGAGSVSPSASPRGHHSVTATRGWNRDIITSPADVRKANFLNPENVKRSKLMLFYWSCFCVTT